MAVQLTRKKTAVLVAAGAVLAVSGAGAAIAAGDDDATEKPITGATLEKAERAALAETGGGEVTETEVDDEESKYEVEVTLDDGSQVDVQLDENFRVVGSERDGDASEEDEHRRQQDPIPDAVVSAHPAPRRATRAPYGHAGRASRGRLACRE